MCKLVNMEVCTPMGMLWRPERAPRNLPLLLSSFLPRQGLSLSQKLTFSRLFEADWPGSTSESPVLSLRCWGYLQGQISTWVLEI